MNNPTKSMKSMSSTIKIKIEKIKDTSKIKIEKIKDRFEKLNLPNKPTPINLTWGINANLINLNNVLIPVDAQRKTSKRDFFKPGTQFDPMLFGSIQIQKHDNKNYVWDGCHRSILALQHGINEVPANVLNFTGTERDLLKKLSDTFINCHDTTKKIEPLSRMVVKSNSNPDGDEAKLISSFKNVGISYDLSTRLYFPQMGSLLQKHTISHIYRKDIDILARAFDDLYTNGKIQVSIFRGLLVFMWVWKKKLPNKDSDLVQIFTEFLKYLSLDRQASSAFEKRYSLKTLDVKIGCVAKSHNQCIAMVIRLSILWNEWDERSNLAYKKLPANHITLLRNKPIQY